MERLGRPLRYFLLKPDTVITGPRLAMIERGANNCHGYSAWECFACALRSVEVTALRAAWKIAILFDHRLCPSCSS